VSLPVDQLKRVAWECVHFTEADDASHVRRQLDGDVCVLEMEADSSGQLPAGIAKAFRFPDYFGENWDALDECLRDLDWLPAPGYVFFVKRASGLWVRDGRQAGSLIESWLTAAEARGRRGVPFHLVFVW
jgi:hypothetical protein